MHLPVNTNMVFWIVLVSVSAVIISGLSPQFPTLTEAQLEQIRQAMADGTIDRINDELQRNGVIFRENSTFEDILTLTPAQDGILTSCYRGSAERVTSVRGKRQTRRVNLACIGRMGMVQYIIDNANRMTQVIDNVPVPMTCDNARELTASCTNCGRGRFLVNAVAFIFANAGSMVDVTQLEIPHCTCLK